MIVKLPSAMTLSNVAQIRETLLSALRSGEALEIDGQEVTEVDVAGLQLLCSLHRGAVLQKTSVAFRMGQLGHVIEEAQSKAGFLRHKGCDAGCLWLESHHE